MRVLVFGCGAIGSLLGAALVDAGADVALLDRGEQFSALSTRGLRIISPAGEMRHVTRFKAVTDPAEFGPADLVVLAVKAHQIRPSLDLLEHALGQETALLTVQNGIPWWYFQRHPGGQADRVLHSVDGDGQLAGRIDPARVIAGVAYPAAEVIEPGLVRHVEGHRFPIGELDGGHSARCQAIAALLERGGLKVPVISDIRSEIWLKAWGNLAFNPVSALTGMTMAEICREPATRALVTRMMTEAAEIARRIGVLMRLPLEKRLSGAERAGHHKTSMLQDLHAGRPLEIDAILGVVLELGGIVDAPVETLRTVQELALAIDPGRRRLGSVDSHTSGPRSGPDPTET